MRLRKKIIKLTELSILKIQYWSFFFWRGERRGLSHTIVRVALYILEEHAAFTFRVTESDSVGCCNN